VSALLVSDREREYTVGLLRGHWLSGRLTADEFEQRVGEACRARFAADLWQALRWLPVDTPAARPVPPAAPAKSASGGASLAFAVAALCVLYFSFGALFFLALPLAIAGWVLGRRALRSAPPGRRGTAAAGHALGIVGTLLSLMPIVAIAGLIGLLL
jgi:Domain of unknown function (DUF1707)